MDHESAERREGVRESWTMDEDGLVAWGEALGRTARTPLVIALRGDLGAGKTTLARAIARGAGVSGPIPSPTYNLLFRYPGSPGVQVVHVDLYRLEDPDEVWALGWSELPADDEVVLIEWPERAERFVPAPRWDVRLTEPGDPALRRLAVTPVGDPPPLRLPGEGG
jgi:tRNA threonylcarbamoyladenosine biosynthesis protein TsaE